MNAGKLSRWLWLGLILNISIMVWRFWVIADQVVALLPYRTVTDWISDPPMYLIFYGSGFVGIQMAVTGDRPLFFWDLVYLVLLVPLPLVRPVWFFGAVIAPLPHILATGECAGNLEPARRTFQTDPLIPMGRSWDRFVVVLGFEDTEDNFLSPGLRSSASPLGA